MNRVMHVGVTHGARPDGEDAADAYYAMQRRYGPADRRRDRELQEARRPCVDTACDALDEFAKQCHEVSTSAGSALGSAPCIASGRLIGEHVLSGYPWRSFRLGPQTRNWNLLEGEMPWQKLDANQAPGTS